MSGPLRDAAIARVGRVATELQAINRTLVFIGGAVLPLLVDVEERFEAPRSTKDVDAVAATATYTAKHRIEQALREARYRDAMDSHAGRFISPSKEIFDISFAGNHAGGSGSKTDELAIATSVERLEAPAFRHVSAVGFFLMKVAAFCDRGAANPYDSKDLADLAVLLVGRPALAHEATAFGSAVCQSVRDAAQRLKPAKQLAGALRTHFHDRRPVAPYVPDDLALEALARLDRLAGLDCSPLPT